MESAVRTEKSDAAAPVEEALEEEKEQEKAEKKKGSILDLKSIFKRGTIITKVAKTSPEDDVNPEDMKPLEYYRYRRNKQDRENLKGLKLISEPRLDEENWEQLEEMVWVRDCYSATRVIRNKRTKTVIYQVIEPVLTTEEKHLFDFLKKILMSTSMKFIIAGGIGSTGDIMRLKELEEYGISGVIAGKALYEGRQPMDLGEAIRIGSKIDHKKDNTLS